MTISSLMIDPLPSAAAVDFAELLNSKPVKRRCRAYLRARLDTRPELMVLAPVGGFTRVLTQRARFPTGPERVAMLSILAERDLDPFARIWIVSRRSVLGSKLLRRYANQLGVLAYAPFSKYPVAYEAVKAMRTGALDVARLYVKQLKVAHVKAKLDLGLDDVNALEAFHAAMSDVPHEAAVRATGLLIDAHSLYGKHEGQMMTICSKRLRGICAKALVTRELRRVRGLQSKEVGEDENP